MRSVDLPPHQGIRSDGLYPGGWWHSEGDEGRIVCDLCPRECHMKPGDRGFCFVRKNVDGEMMLTTYGRSTGFCIDPIEKKPLNHFLPGTSVLSFGTAGCNLGCKFCQNWDISKSREVARLSELAGPEAVAEAARHFGCQSVAYTYNDPVIWAEYAIDTSKACHAVGIKNVAVTAGYISPQARAPFYEHIDAANIDLKAFSEEFYYRITYSHMQPVLETLEWLKRETDVWFEITNLIIPDANDSEDEIRQMCDWILSHVGDEVPVHFTAFHPDFRMKDRPATPPETLVAARSIALKQGLKFVYVGNVNDVVHQSTYCPHCGGLLIQRNWYELGQYHLHGSRCGHCDGPIAGVFADQPGDWGRKRQPVRISDFARPLPVISTSPASKQESSPMSSVTKNDGGSARLKAQRPKLTADQEQQVLNAACEWVAAAIDHRPAEVADPQLGGCGDRTVMGSFVTLKRSGRLRACCGALGRPMPLATAVQQAALRTATEDARLPTISPSELPYLDVDVSLLFAFQPVTASAADRVGAVEVGRHGLQIRRGDQAGLLLPSVATEQGYNSEEFLRQVCRKAGLPTTAWEDEKTELQTFETASIAGTFASDRILTPRVAPILTTEELKSLAAHCGNNIVALAQGATPSYYAAGVADGNVNGIAISLSAAGSDSAVHFFRLSMRPAMPLQSTAYNLAESIAAALRSGQLRLEGGNVNVGVSLLYDPAMHGTVAEPDVRGVDPTHRAILISEGGKAGWAFDPEKSAEDLLLSAGEQVRVFQPAAASVFSFEVQSTQSKMAVSTAPRPVRGTDVRPPAVSGRFYPADAEDLQKMVDGFLSAAAEPKRSVPAIMVPHAGLIYSGNIAGQVFGQTEIPDTVIVLSPKHTRAGVEWAVAPCQSWSIPGHTLAADTELADKLVAAIDHLEMDASAHQGEHGIEVELPFLARLNPNVKVVGITIGGGNLEQCRHFADQLVKVLDDCETQPLLIISSDMNHYAPDDENRRLDEIAMEALETKDPGTVYEKVTGHGISMCGVLPAVIVMEALQKRGGIERAERIAYSTSGEVSGDKSRVVGYCGMQFA